MIPIKVHQALKSSETSRSRWITSLPDRLLKLNRSTDKRLMRTTRSIGPSSTITRLRELPIIHLNQITMADHLPDTI